MIFKYSRLLLLMMATLFITNAYAQDNESPMDTLTRNVATINSALDVMKRIKITGYLDPQYQVADSAGAKSYEGGDFAPGVDKRFQVREARVKITYTSPLNDKGWSTSQYVFQVDVSEKGVAVKDMYAKMTDPWIGYFSVTAGMQNRPFGYEIPFSTADRESPDRARMSQILFPGERDLGAMLTIQAPKTSNWNMLKIDAGFFNGSGNPGGANIVNGVPSGTSNSSDFDKFKDFIGHIMVNRTSANEKMKWGLGASYYDGGFRQDTVNSYKYGVDSIGIKGYELDVKKGDITPTISTRSEIKKNYVGVDGQFSISWLAGLTTIRAEYIQGKQPGTSTSSTSTSVPISSSLFTRNFNGAYFYFVQSIGQSPWQVVVKYDWYDPNTDVKGDEIGKPVKQTGYISTNATDIKYTTLGTGLAYRLDANLKIIAYYAMVTNETSANLAGYSKDIKDNVFTLRMQVKF